MDINYGKRERGFTELDDTLSDRAMKLYSTEMIQTSFSEDLRASSFNKVMTIPTVVSRNAKYMANEVIIATGSQRKNFRCPANLSFSAEASRLSIMGKGQSLKHTLTPWIKVEGTKITYLPLSSQQD